MFKFGGSAEFRTRDQRIKSPLLYRLSYRPNFLFCKRSRHFIQNFCKVKIFIFYFTNILANIYINQRFIFIYFYLFLFAFILLLHQHVPKSRFLCIKRQKLHSPKSNTFAINVIPKFYILEKMLIAKLCRRTQSAKR